MSQTGIKSYRDLEVWRRSKAFAVEIYRVTKTLPAQERYGLTDQMRRAAVSVPSNIAEGHIKGSDKAFAFHLNVAFFSDRRPTTNDRRRLDDSPSFRRSTVNGRRS